ncbi:hypothetical protein BC629DRAFT_1441025 [Irpex lacteus]|nr:hypothetical protein BC629DRAFT_1441025 [Irpex lacteus]
MIVDDTTSPRAPPRALPPSPRRVSELPTQLPPPNSPLPPLPAILDTNRDELQAIADRRDQTTAAQEEERPDSLTVTVIPPTPSWDINLFRRRTSNSTEATESTEIEITYSSFTDVYVDATPRIDVINLPTTTERVMEARTQIEQGAAPDPSHPQVPVWKITQQPARPIRQNERLWIHMESENITAPYEDAFIVVDGVSWGKDLAIIKVQSEAGVHTPIRLFAKPEWVEQREDAHSHEGREGQSRWGRLKSLMCCGTEITARETPETPTQNRKQKTPKGTKTTTSKTTASAKAKADTHASKYAVKSRAPHTACKKTQNTPATQPQKTTGGEKCKSPGTEQTEPP